MLSKITRPIADDENISIGNDDRQWLRKELHNDHRLMRNLVDEILNEDDFCVALSVVYQGLLESRWLRDAYISWYRKNEKISLFEVTSLDWMNIEIFRLICSLRKFQGWSDQRLFELELFAKKIK